MAIQPYQTADQYSIFQTAFGDNLAAVNGVKLTTVGNPDLRWEGTESYNVGLDFGLLLDRITGTIDAYKSKSHDLLMSRTIPAVNGYLAVMDNIGKVANKGFEVTLNTVNIKNKNVEWRSTFDFSLNRDKIIALREDNLDDVGNGWYIGQPINAARKFNILGLWQLADSVQLKTYAKQASFGKAKYEDVNNDGVFDIKDQSFKRTLPSWMGGIGNDVKYKNFTFSMFVHIVAGSRKNNSWMDPANWNNYWEGLDYWTPTNPTNKISTPGSGLGSGAGGWVNASYVRIRDASIMYSFPKRITDKLKLDNLKVYLRCNNLYTFTNWIGWDPEATGTIPYPSMRSFRLGFNFGL